MLQPPAGGPVLVGEVDEDGLLIQSSIQGLLEGLNRLASEAGDTTCLGLGDESKIDVKHGIRLLGYMGCNRFGDVGSELMGLVTGPSYVCRKCICNLHNALCNRHLRTQNPCQALDGAAAYFRSRQTEFQNIYLQELEYWRDNWAAKWSQSKMAAILESVEYDLLKPGSIKMFVKREGGHKPITKARGIQPYANMKTQAEYAIEFLAVQKAFARVYAQPSRQSRDIRVTFASGMNSADLGSWMTWVTNHYKDVRFYERDGANWDASMSHEHHVLKRGVYSSVSPDLARFADECYRVKGVGRSRGSYRASVTYQACGTTKSGHNDTSTGNSIVNAGIAIEAMLRLGLSGSILVAGDDLLVAVEGDFDEVAFAAIEEQFGINPEYRKFTDWSQVSFISGCWYPGVDGSHVFGPLIGRLLRRLFWTTKTVSKKRRDEWLRGVVSGLRPVCGKIPIIGEWLAIHDPGEGVIGKTGRNYAMYAVEVEVDEDECVAMLCQRYGFSPCQLRDLRDHILTLRGRGVVVHPELEWVCEVDLAPIEQRNW